MPLCSALPCLSCHYQAIIQTAVVCATAAAGYSTSVGTNILQTTASSQCGAGIYDLSALNSQDLYITVNSTTGGTNYSYAMRVCGSVTSSTACNGTGLTSICQYNVNSPATGGIALATFNPTVSPVVWSYNGNGLSQIQQAGAGCAAANQNRFTNLTFVCSPSASTPVVLSEVESPICHYTILLATNAVCGAAFAVARPGSSTAAITTVPAATSTPSPSLTSPRTFTSTPSNLTPTSLPSATSLPSTAAPPASGDGGGGSSSGLSNGAIAGIVIGSVVGALLCLALLLVVACRGRGGGKDTTGRTGGEGQYDPHSDVHTEDSKAHSEVEMR